MIKTTIEQLLGAAESFKELAANKKINASMAWNIVKLTDEINKQLKQFEEVRVEKVKQFGTAKESGDIEILPNSEAMINFQKDLQPLLEKEVEIQGEMIKVSELKDSSGAPIEISAAVLMALKWMLED